MNIVKNKDELLSGFDAQSGSASSAAASAVGFYAEANERESESEIRSSTGIKCVML